MAEDTLKIKVDLDSEAVVENVGKIEKSFEDLEKSIEESGKNIGNSLSEGIDQADSSLESLSQSTEQTGGILTSLKQFLSDVVDGFKEVWEAESNTAKSMEDLAESSGALSDEMSSSADSSSQAANGVEQVGDSSEESSEAVESLCEAINASVVALTALYGAATVAYGALSVLLNKVAAYGDTVDKQSQVIGMSTEAYQEWDYILQRCGSSISEASIGFRTFNNKLAEAVSGSESATQSFAALGISYSDLTNKSSEEVFSNVISKLQGMDDVARRTALATDLLGRSAQQLAPLLNTSAQETENLRRKVHELGGVMSEEQVRASAQFTDAMLNVKTAMRGVEIELTSGLIPAAAKFADAFAEAISSGGSQESITNLRQASKELISAFKEAGQQIIPLIIELGPQIIAVVSNIISQLIPVIINLLRQLVVEIITELPEMFMNLDLGSQLLASLIGGFVALNTAMKFMEWAKKAKEFVKMMYELSTSQTVATAAQLLLNLAIESMPYILLATAIAMIILLATELVLAAKEAAGSWEQLGQTMLDAILSPFTRIFDIMDSLIDSFQRLGENAGRNIQDLFNSFRTAGGKINEIASELGENVANAFQNSSNRLQSVGKSMADAIGSGLVSIKIFIAELITNLDELSSRISEGIQNAVNKMVDSFKRAFAYVINQFRTLGDNIIQGLIDGITSKFTRLYSMVQKGLNTLKSTVQEMFGIHSPSKVFRYYGEMCVAGFEQGLEPLSESFDYTSDNIQASLPNTVANTTGGDFAQQGSYNMNNNVVVELVGETAELFRVMIRENKQYYTSTGRSAFAGGV